MVEKEKEEKKETKLTDLPGIGPAVAKKLEDAVKAFIVKNDKLFIIKRSADDVQKPNIWEIPGGRLELGEDPILGLVREVKEETGLDIWPIMPLNIRHFMRADKQKITMIIFLCRLNSGILKMSEEHTDYKFVEIEKAKELLADFFHKELGIFKRLKKANYI